MTWSWSYVGITLFTYVTISLNIKSFGKSIDNCWVATISIFLQFHILVYLQYFNLLIYSFHPGDEASMVLVLVIVVTQEVSIWNIHVVVLLRFMCSFSQLADEASDLPLSFDMTSLCCAGSQSVSYLNDSITRFWITMYQK